MTGTLTGINHLALITSNMDAFLDFYVDVLGATVTLDMREDGMRHAFVDIGGGAVLHPFELPDNPDGHGRAGMFGRGHLDHFAINVPDEDTLQTLRERLVSAGASDGMLTDFGVVRTVFFTDPDGHEVEIAAWAGGAPRRFEDRGLEAYEPDRVTH